MPSLTPSPCPHAHHHSACRFSPELMVTERSKNPHFMLAAHPTFDMSGMMGPLDAAFPAGAKVGGEELQYCCSNDCDAECRCGVWPSTCHRSCWRGAPEWYLWASFGGRRRGENARIVNCVTAHSSRDGVPQRSDWELAGLSCLTVTVASLN